MFRRLLITVCIPLLCFSNPESWKAENVEEALFLRRIADFWEEGEYEIAKNQMEEFLHAFPESSFKNPLSAALGDLFLREKNYSTALNYYAQISSTELSDAVFLNRMQCFYHLQWHATLADECEKRLQQEGLDPDQKLQTTYFLAIALYQQCLNAQEPEMRTRLAQRAQPYFSTLFESELSREAAESFAHLCCILKDYSKASDIYLDLADQEEGDEMVFQAALIQAEYDKELACETFYDLSQKEGKKAQEAAYNWLVLEFELGRFSELLEKKEQILKTVPEDRQALAHFFLGKSFFALKQYPEALSELQIYLTDSLPSDASRTALLLLLEIATELNDLVTFNTAFGKFEQSYPTDPQLPKGFFLRAQLLKHLGQKEEAIAEIENLLTRYPDFSLKAEALLELISLDYDMKSWADCTKRARSFLSQYPDHELSSFVVRYLASATAELAVYDTSERNSLISILEQLLSKKELFPDHLDWEFLLAKTYFDQKNYRKAKEILEPLLKEEELFAQKTNALLLLGLCHRDTHDLPSFCSLAEQALENKADLIDPGSLHASLFNAYLDQNDLSRAADHLFAAFENQAKIQKENLLWLVEIFAELPEKAEKTAHLIEFLLNQPDIDQKSLACKLATAYGYLGKVDDQITLLESLPNPPQEATLLLGEAYALQGKKDEALSLFNAIVAESGTTRSKTSARASLQSVRLSLEQNLPMPQIEKLLVQLKDLVLQKNFQNEPLHLEAAIESVELQSSLSPEKRLALWTKTKHWFEKDDDLLSKDYQKAREYFPQIDLIYRNYLEYMEAEILLASNEKELQAKAKNLLLQIIDQNAHPELSARAKKRIDAIEKQN